MRIRRVPELAPAGAIASNPAWTAFASIYEQIPLAALDDLVWADGIALGSPTRFGGPAFQLKAFLDATGALWAGGALADKVGTSLTAASTAHGGLESTILAINNVFYHWGAIVLPLGYASEDAAATGNPYGPSHVRRKGSVPSDAELKVARWQGRRLARVAEALRPLRATAAQADDQGGGRDGVA